MKTAVIITGQARTFAHCFPTQREAVFRRLETPTFFVSLADDEPGRAAVDTLIRFYGSNQVVAELVEQEEMPEDDRERFEKASLHAPYFRSVPVEAIWKQFWHLYRGWQLLTNQASLGEYQHFIRIRPDLHFHRWTPPTPLLEGRIGGAREGVYAPWWGSWGGCPDRFAYINQWGAAEQYFSIFHRIDQLISDGCAFHPETMLARWLERAGVPVRQTMDADFTTIRVKGDNRPHDGPSYNNRDLFAYVNARLAEGDR